MTHETLARAMTPRGEVVLRRDEAGVLELRVNGVFVMDSARVATEEALAAVILDRLADPGLVVVGGLGLGFTVGRLLADQRVREIVVAEIEPPVAEWMRDGTVPHGPAIMSDSRLRLEVADVREVLAAEPAHTLDAVLLDVDNGPDGLVHDANATVYDPAFLDMCASRLRPHGWLGIWSATASTALESALRDTIGPCERVPYAVDLDGRPEEYSVYVACTSPQR
jgi:spermidine synthase